MGKLHANHGQALRMCETVSLKHYKMEIIIHNILIFKMLTRLRVSVRLYPGAVS